MTFRDGKIYFGIPTIEFPARIGDVRAPRNIVQHTIPGRDGDIVDDIGSPSREMTIEIEINDSMLKNKAKVCWGVLDGIVLDNTLNFMKWLDFLWLNKLDVPILSVPLTTIVHIKNKPIHWEGGKAGRFIIKLDLIERLPYSLSSILGQITFGSLWALYGGLE